MEPFKVKLEKLLGGTTKCCHKEVGYSLSRKVYYPILNTCKQCYSNYTLSNVDRHLKNEKPIFHLMCNINSYLIQHDFYVLLTVEEYIDVSSLLEDIQHNIQKLQSPTITILSGYKQRLDKLKEKNWQCFELFNLIELSLEYQYEDNIVAFFTKFRNRERFNSIITDVFPEEPSTKKLLKKPPTSVEDVNNLISVLYNMPGDFLSTEVMGILADAVEEYIPDIPTKILSHLRDIKMPHYRGCWAVEYLRGSFNNV